MLHERLVFLWWKDVFRLNTLYRGVARCTIGDGSIVLFLEDLWSQEILATTFPRLFSFAHNEHASVKHIMDAHDLESIFHLPLTQEAHHEMLDLQEYLQEIHTMMKTRINGVSYGEVTTMYQTRCISLSL